MNQMKSGKETEKADKKKRRPEGKISFGSPVQAQKQPAGADDSGAEKGMGMNHGQSGNKKSSRKKQAAFLTKSSLV